MKEENLLTERQAAKILNMSISTLQTHRSKGIGAPFVKLPTKAVRYERSALDKYISENVVSHD